MNEDRFLQRRLHNLGLSLLTIGAMGVLLGVVGAVIAGGFGFVLACATGMTMAVMGLRASRDARLMVRGGRQLSTWDAPELVEMTQRLARRAGLASAPTLIYVPIGQIAAFSFGTREEGSIAITDGLLRALSHAETEGVIAHELSHLAKGDVPLLMLSDHVFNLTAMLARIGVFLLILNLPLMAMTGTHIAWPVVVLLVAAPILSLLLKLSLSRTREFEADLNAAHLTGSPRGLMSALAKIERHSASLMQRLFGLPSQEALIPHMLRTHPDTRERIRRLAELQQRPDGAAAPFARTDRLHVI